MSTDTKTVTIDNPAATQDQTPVEPVRTKTLRMTQAEKQRILRLREVNKLPINEIAPLVNRSVSTIYEYLQRVNPENQALQQFKGKEADTLAYTKSISRGLRIRLLETMAKKGEDALSEMTPEQISSVNQRLAIAEGIDTEKERLIRGLSTQNVLYGDVAKRETEIDREIEQLRSRLGIPLDVVVEANVTQDSTDVTQ